jgi:tRNA A37 threonylcarbamoyladenosine dehydratase
MNAADTARRFGGIDRLYGAGSLAILAQRHACVIGIGGVGSWAAEALVRSGVGRLTLIDLDHVAESNVNRQIQALDTTLGMAKVIAMRERIALINPDCVVECVEDFISEDNLATLLPVCDGVIDAIDNVRAKAALIAHCRRAKRPLITTGGAGGRRDPARIEVVDLARTEQDVLASKVRARLRKEHGFPREPKKKFGVPCVYSPEPIRRPTSADLCATPADGGAGLSCAGYGSAVMVTAAFGMTAAAHLIEIFLESP